MKAFLPIVFSTITLPALWALPAIPARAENASVSLAAAKGSAREVAAFLRRRAGCSRLSEADSDDPERVAASVQARFSMKCSTLDDDERRLRARYADDPDAIAALDQNDD